MPPWKRQKKDVAPAPTPAHRFRDAHCHAAGIWTTSKEKYRMEDANLYTIVEEHHKKLTPQVTDTQDELMKVIHEEATESKDNKQKMHQIIKDGDYSGKNPPLLPTCFRKLYDQDILDCGTLLRIKLVLDGGFLKADSGACEDRFLCAWIETEDLPWDQRETIW